MINVYLLSREGDYPDFPGIEYDWLHGNTIEYENGFVHLDSCAVVEYDMQVRDGTGDPIGAHCSDEPYFFFRTMIVLDALGDPQ